MKTRITRQAWRDLDEIYDWIAVDDRAAAERTVERLADQATAIGERPFSFPVVDRREGIDLRKRSVRPYVIIFRVTGEVEVVRVVHMRRDYLSFL